VEDLPHLSGITLEAEVRRAQILERTGDEAGALSAWERVARGYEPVDGAAGEVRVEVLEATGRLARGWEAAGAEARRDSMLEAEVVRLEAAAEKQHGRGGAAGLLDAVGEVQEMRGDLDAARNAWRRALAEPAPDSARARRVLEMGERWLRAERPDSAMAWARWPLGQFFGDARRDALDLQARAWRAVGLPDSALAVYDRILAEFNRDPDATAEARFQRALVLEERDRWMQARAEFSALCASQPTHPRALEAWVRVVTHLEHAGERDMANLEARHALDAMDGLLATQHDEAVRRRVGETRAAVMLAQGKPREAIEALRTVWNVSGLSLEGSALGARVAAAASAELHDEALARSLWQILAERAPDPEIRRQARAQLERRSS
jgi:tetratricopeptide (TPR) repeat protein